MKLDDSFMRQFRWITPLLLALTVFLLQDIYRDFKALKEDMNQMKIDLAVAQALTKAAVKSKRDE